MRGRQADRARFQDSTWAVRRQIVFVRFVSFRPILKMKPFALCSLLVSTSAEYRNGIEPRARRVVSFYMQLLSSWGASEPLSELPSPWLMPKTCNPLTVA